MSSELPGPGATLPLAAGDDAVPPTTLGRFRIVRLLGRGGMGIVLEGYDPSLDRHVALKLLRPEVWGGSRRGRARIAREAQAMARLSHPNVVVVHEVGEIDGQPFLAMERIDGETLRAWQDRPRPWRDVVAMYIAAGRGLAAAHASGLVHRDFKPENVLVGRDGRPRVTDFGMVTSRPEEATAAELRDLRSSISSDGSAIGTPAYMSPEHWAGAEVDARSDQFSFCVALWEAVYRQRPFAGDDVKTLRARVLEGSVPPSGATTGRPRRLAAVLRRGLARHPGDRWPSMVALLAALEQIARGARTRRVVAAAAGAVAIAGAVTAVVWVGRGDASSSTAPPVAPLPHAAGPPVALTHLGGCAFAPAFLDDHHVSFELTRGGAVDLYRLALDGEPERLTSDAGWEWMSARGPTPGQVVYLVQGGNVEPRVDQLDLASHARTTIYAGSAYVAWASGAYYLAPAASGQVHRLRGQVDEVIADVSERGDAVQITAAHDGSRLAVTTHRSGTPADLCVIGVNDGKTTCPLELASLPRAARPSGTRVGFGSKADVLYYDAPGGIHRLTLDGSPPVAVLTDRAKGGLTVAPSGSALVFSQCRTHSRLTSIPEDPARDSLGPEASAATYSRVGSLAYVRNGNTLTVRSREGHVRDLIALEHGSISELAFSPDGEAVAYHVNDADAGGIYLIALKPSPANRLTEDPHDGSPVVVKDAVVFTRTGADGTPQLMRIGIDGSNLQVLSKRPRISLDADPRGRILTITPARDHLFWMDPATGAETAGPVLVTQKAARVIHLSADGRWLVALTGGSGRSIVRLSLDSPAAVPELVRQVADDLSVTSATIDDAGRPLVTVASYSGELWIARAAPGTRW